MGEKAAYRTIAGSTRVPEQVHVPVVSDSYESGQNADRGNGDGWTGSPRELVKTPVRFAAVMSKLRGNCVGTWWEWMIWDRSL